MKKVISVLLALLMVGSAFAAFAESPTGGNFNTVTVQETAAFGFGIMDDEAALAKANAVIEALAAAEDKAAFFGLADELAAILGEGEIKVNELWPVYAENYTEDMGAQTIELTFATPYEAGQKVAVLISNALDGDLTWKCFEAEATDAGAVAVQLDPATLLAVQASNALLAVASK